MKTHLTKRLVALFLTLAMVFSLAPMTFAEEPAADEYVLAAEVKDGDKVVIVNPAAGMALSNADLSEAQPSYRAGVAVTPEEGKLTNPETAIVWTVEETEGGVRLLDAEGRKLSMASKGLELDKENDVWEIRSLGENNVALVNVNAAPGSSGDPKALEWYNKYSEFSTHYLNTGDSQFIHQLYVLAENETPEDPEDPEEPESSEDIVVLYTNDIHCGVDQTDSSIGIAGLAKIKKDLQAEHEFVTLVDNGDAVQGELIGTISKGEYMVQLMNYVGFDYATFGNHEFDYSMEQLKKLVDMAEAEYLSCNFRYVGPESNTEALKAAPMAVADYDGFKVAYVGITTPESLVKSTPTYFQDENGEWIYTFCNDDSGELLYNAVQAAVDDARAEGADVVVALAHLGIDEQSSPWMSTEVIANTTGIDVVLDGHSHSTIAKQEVLNKDGKTVLLSSTGTKLANVGKLTITREGEVNTELITRADVDGVDPDTQAYLEQIEAQFEELKQQVVAHTDADLLTKDPETGSRMVRMRETNLGNACADAYRSVLAADIAFVNGGGVRADIPAGDVTYAQIINVHPYGNMACKVKTTGQQILDALEMASRSVTMDEEGNLSGENGGFLQVSGLKYTINTGVESTVRVDENKMFLGVDGERRVQDVQVLQADGSYLPIDPAGTYTLASHNYMLKQSGDGLNMFRNDELLLDEVKVDNQVLIEYMTSDEFSAHDYSDWKGEGRITIIREEHEPLELSGKTVILHTNDTHGALLGFAQVAQVKKDLEAKGAKVILVDAGDYSQGTTYVSSNKGAAAVTMMNAAGYDFATLGNHEFDFGYAQLMENMSKAEFLPIVADVLLKESGESIFDGHAIKEVGGVKIGFFGMETPETFTKVNPGLIQEITFPQGEDMYACAQAEVDALKAEGADLIIGLVHLGVDSESVPNRSIDLYEHVTGIDFLIDGHSHTVMTEGPNGEPIQSTGTKASKTALMNVGLIQIDNETKTIEKNELIPLGEEAAKDPAVAEIAQQIMDEVDAEYGAKFAESLVELNGDKAPGNRNMETNLGDLITDSMRWGVLKEGSLDVPDENVVAITNGGGIRAWIHVGDVTKNDVNTVLPFGNTVAVVYVTGAELLEALEASTYSTPGAVGGFPQVAGMKFNIDVSKEYDKGEQYPESTYYGPASIRRVSIQEVNGQPFDPEAVYAVVTNNFCAAGGDTYYAFKAASKQFDTGLPMDEVLMDYVEHELGGVIGQQYAEPQGRITQEELKPNTEFEFLVTSDLHGQIFATDYTLPYASSGTYSRGLTRVATYIKEQRAAYGDNLYVVDMGDTFQGAPLTYYYAFNKPEAKDPAILAFRSIGYDMWVVGNHEFNYGLPILTRQMDYAVSEGDENEKQLTISMANYLKAETNSDESKDWATWRDVAPYVIKDYDGFRVAVIGFGNPNIPQWDVPANWEGIYFADIIETYKHYEPEMKEQADMIVVVAHSGTDSDPNSDFIKQLVEETDSIAFAFSGHEHKNTITRVTNAAGKEIPILSPYTKARRIAQVKVTVENGEYTIAPELKNMENYPLDEDLVALLQPYETDTWENYMLQPIGVALGDYPAANLGTAPSAFMDLINTVQTWGAYDNTGLNTPDKTEDDVPAMLSISAPLTSGSNANLISEGPIVLGDMFGLYRFENWFYQITMSGEEVHQWLEFAATKIRVDGEGKPYVTNGDLTYYDVIMGDGFHYDIDVSRPEGQRVVNMSYQGAKVEADQTFTVVVNNYRYNGGGNYVKWLNDHGCEFVANDPERIIYSTQFDMIQGEDEGQARALLVSYIKKETAEHGGITPFITSTWTVQNGIELPEEPAFTTVFPSVSNDDIAKYGNIYTSADGADFFAEGYTWGDVVTVKFLDQELDLPIVPTFTYVESGTPGVFVNKDAEGNPTGRMFMAINMGNFAEAYGLAVKTTNADKTYFWTAVEGVEFPVELSISMKEAGGYLSEMLLRDVNRTDNREDYPNLSDEEFANFRQITTSGMGDHLYRGSSPINPEIGRNTYADAALENAKVTVIMNLADSQSEAEAYEGFADTYYSQQNVIYLNLGVEFAEENFKSGLAAGLRHFAENKGVYYVHCTEGKDRAGYVSAVLECLMGASYDEVVADYLKTYTNYFNVVDGVQQPLSEESLDAIAQSNIVKSLCRAFEVEDLKTADLAVEAEEYVTELGLSAEEIAALKANLSGSYEPEEPEDPEEPTSGYVLAESVEAGDRILYVVEYDGTLYAMTNDTSISNAMGAAAVVANESGVIEAVPVEATWKLEAGETEGSFLLKDCNDKYLKNPSGTGLQLDDSGSAFTVVCGAGTSALNLLPETSNRQIFLRDNNGLQFRCYNKQNATAEGYCAVLSVYKWVEE